MNRYRVSTLLLAVVFLLTVLCLGSADATAATEELTWVDLGQVLPDGTAINAITSTGGEIVGGSAVSPVMLFGYDVAAGVNRQKATTFAVGVLAPRDATSVYVGTLAVGAQGHLWAYTPSTAALVDLGQINAEYAHGLTVGHDGKVYVSACCNGAFSIYDPATSTWNYKGRILANYLRLSALATAADGMIYGTTSRIWITPAGGAALYKYNPSTGAATLLHTISAGIRESWNLLYNPLDQRLYGSVSYQMVPRLFVYDPQHPELAIQDLGAVGATSGDLMPGEMAVAPDGKVYVKAGGMLYRYDPRRPGDGLVFISSGVHGRMVFGADGYLYRIQDRRLLRTTTPLAPPTYSVSGQISDQDNAPLEGVTVCTQNGTCAMTDAAGSYSLTDLVAGSYTVTPSKSGHTFTPPSLPVAVPPSAPNVNFAGWPSIAPISIDFVLTRDGYSFPNFNDPNGRDFNKEELALMCGWENTCTNPQSPGASCQIKPEADKWLKDVADDAIGHCRGITTSALRFFTDFDQPAEFQAGATTVHELNLGNSRRNITWQHVLQYLPNMEAQETSPVTALQRVYQAFQTGGQALVELSVYQINSDGSGNGHTVLPYAIEDAGGGAWRIMVYDNAAPGDTSRYILVDTATNTFSSTLHGPAANWTDKISVEPLSMYLQTPVCNWTNGASVQEVTGQVSVLADDLTGLLLTDVQGRRIGYVAGQMVNEIPGAFLQTLTGGADVAHQPVYHLPATSDYTVEISGASGSPSSPGSVNLYGAGYMLGLDGLVSSGSSPDRLVFSAGGDSVTFEAGEAKEVDLTLIGGPDNNQAFTIRGADAPTGGSVSFSQDTATGQATVDYQNAASGWYTLVITNVTTLGEDVFYHSDIPAETGDSHVLDIASLSDDSLEMCVDENSDGTLDECEELSDQSPEIDSFVPDAAPVGSEIVVNGHYLAAAGSVTINGVEAAFTVVSDSKLLVIVGAGATTGKIAVVTPAGTATSAADFTIIPAPAISGFIPTTGPVGTAVTITGANLTGATAVQFNGTAAVFTVVSATQIDATVPAGATTGKISVTTPGGTAESAADFTVIPAPTISGFTPTSGPTGTPVTISGANLTDATAVQFNSTAAVFTVVSATQIDATVPAGATTGKITITTPAGTATSAADFTVTTPPPPAIYLSPTAAGKLGVGPTAKTFTGADILSYNKAANAWDVLYDGSTIKTTKNVGAFAFLGDGIVLGFSAAQTVPGLGKTAPQDLVRFAPTALGYNTTAGSFAWFFDGSDVGLTTSAEAIDALWLDAAGRLYVSTAGAGEVPVNPAQPTGAKFKFQDEDVLRFTPAAGSSGANTAGVWELYWDPTGITKMGAEDVNGYWEDPATGDRYVTILGAFTIGSATTGGVFSGNGATILRFAPNAAAPGGWAPAEKVTWLAPGATLPAKFAIDGLEMAR